MLPSALVSQLQQGMRDFLRTSFWSSTPAFGGLIENFIHERGALFQGPFVSLKLPFEQGGGASDYFDDVPMRFPPYAHQLSAFERLGGRQKESTIVATGTGSGKTECFLMPILADCARRAGEAGIKAILIYPMNALASDQAERLAETIWENPKLNGHVTAGLYVGSSEASPSTTMGPRNVITDKGTLRKHPPDILLTNYKMLDYLLIRPEDQPLWRDNGTETLQYLVVDELHTFDGAQGTDLACLIRRLKARLMIPQEHLCCVGTSATLGGQAGQVDAASAELVSYAEQIFAEEFAPGAVVTEARQTPGEFVGEDLINELHPPIPNDFSVMDPQSYVNDAEYLSKQVELWFPQLVDGAAPSQQTLVDDQEPQGRLRLRDQVDRLELGKRLKGHGFFRNVLTTTHERVLSVDEIIERFRSRNLPAFERLSDEEARLILFSLFSLVSAARSPVPETGEQRSKREERGEPRPLIPFVQVQVQLWQREMRRMVATVTRTPRLMFFDDLTAHQRQRILPTIHCRDCGAMGWASFVYKDRPNNLTIDLKVFYRAYFARDPRVAFIFPRGGGPPGPTWYLDSDTLAKRRDRNEKWDEDDYIEVVLPDVTERSGGRAPKLSNDCPCCGAHESVSLLGFQAATLTSTYINQLFASRFNDDKKLLTFSDSVQDAAHRAGFFGARTWRFNLRIAIQQVVDELGSVPLSELPERVVEHWGAEWADEPERFITTFIAPNMKWLRAYEQMIESGSISADDELWEMITRRLSWEIHNEYALRARIGRSLPRTSASIAHVDRELLDRAVDRLLEPLRNELGGLEALDDDRLRMILAGFLHRLRERGAVFQPELPSQYVMSGGSNTFMFKKHPHLPGYSPTSRLPAFLMTPSGSRRFDGISRRTTHRRTWYESWFERNVVDILPMPGDAAEYFYDMVLEGLVDVGILDVRPTKVNRVWGIQPEALVVTKDVTSVRCSETGERVNVGEHEAETWLSMPSIANPQKRYSEIEGDRANYYAKLYRSGELERVVAAEHTGLLERDAREELEEHFKATEPRPWDPNLLSCTPTLEMGIDIGDLSSAILCSVPPTQANYLQRVGRAGRRDGNALLLTLANSRPHDLYFFSEPTEMIAGQVDTPGVFLNASSVLQRQLTAFCFDRWIATGVTREQFPKKLSTVFAALDDTEEHERFPFNFLRYIDNHQTELLDRFRGLFDVLHDDTFEELRRFMGGADGFQSSPLNWQIRNGLQELRNERDNHKNAINRLTNKVDKLMALDVRDASQDDELRDLIQEKSALYRLVRDLRKRNVLNYFTDEGLIPNYAFPEAGVTLKSVIWRRKQKVEEGEEQYETWSYEYERAASSAIVELAPENSFYAGGRQVRVSQVDIMGSTIEPWRFCDRCDHSEMVAGKDNRKSCAACGSPGWSDQGQRRSMLKLRQVYASASDRDSRIDDDRDARSPMFYNRQMLVTFGADALEQSWAIGEESVPFGYEYIRSTTFREINFGEESETGEKFRVAGRESVRIGFKLCEDCGMVQRYNQPPQHAFSCKSRTGNREAEYEDCLYLYREFSSEAIRLLLPFIDEPGYKEKLHSFVAALEMGLRVHFGGRIDHLRTTLYTEPVEGSHRRKQFLMLYDTVPGGTGYLKELARDPSLQEQGAMLGVLQAAMDRLTACSCNADPDKDGCYQCLFAYRNSYDMAETSRNAAVDVIGGILNHRDKVTEVESLGAVSINALFESELEARFIEALRRPAALGLEPTLQKEVVRGRPGYRYQLGEQTWLIEPQVALGPDDGVVARTRADFVFWPARQTDQRRPIAVYTDGWADHQERIARDWYQRMALLQSGDFHVWSLTWQDVDDVFESQKGFWRDLFRIEGRDTNRKVFRGLLDGFMLQDFQDRSGGSSLELLRAYLGSAPEDRLKWELHAFAHGLTPVLTQELCGSRDTAAWRSALDEVAPANLADAMTAYDHVGGFARAEDGVRYRLFATAPDSAIQAKDPSSMRVLFWLDDIPVVRELEGFREIWNGALRALNVLQFLPEVYFVAEHGQEECDYAEVLAGTLKAEVYDPEFEKWALVEELLLDVPHKKLAGELGECGVPAPRCGYELPGGRGAVAELAWVDAAVALILPEDEEPHGYRDNRKKFEDAGWRVFDIDEFYDAPNVLAGVLAEEGA